MPHALAAPRLTASLLAAALLAGGPAAPALAQTNADNAAALDAAYQRGRASPAPPRGLAQEARCAAAWDAVDRIYAENDFELPAGLDAAILAAQAGRWAAALTAKGEAGIRALEHARTQVIGPALAGDQWDRILEIAGGCGLRR